MFVHGDNLTQKETHETEYNEDSFRAMLAEIRPRYDAWKAANLALIGPLRKATADDSSIITRRVALFNEYKDFLDQKHYAEAFDSRSNLHSTILEEFMYYLFKDIVTEFSSHAVLGKCFSFKDVFFLSKNYSDMLSNPNVFLEGKNHDFAIGASLNVTFKCAGTTSIQTEEIAVPAIAIECKTYLDKTMLQDVSTAAEQLKARNPNAVYIVVAEWLKLTEAVNLRKYKVDQFYVLRKQKNTDRKFRLKDGYVKNPVYPDVIEHLFNRVRFTLSEDWQGGIAHGLDRGYLIGD